MDLINNEYSDELNTQPQTQAQTQIQKAPAPAPTPAPAASSTPTLVEVIVKDENTALNLLVSFLQLANKRGTFNLEEAAKIWECVKKFTKK